MPHRPATLCAGTLALALVAAHPGASQRVTPYEFENRDGVWSITPGGDEPMTALKLTPAERAIVVSKRDELFAAIQKTASFNPPRGLALRASKTVIAAADDRGEMPLTAPLRMQAAVTVGRFTRRPSGEVIPFTTEMPRLQLISNDLRIQGKFTSFWYEGLRDAEGRALYLEPRSEPVSLVPRVGTPVYRLDESRYVVAITNGRPLFVRVTAEHFLRAMMSYMDREYAATTDRRRDSGLPPAAEAQSFELQRRKVFERELAALTPAQRQAPAYYARAEDPMRSGLASPAALGARPVVMQNEEYFDRTLPRTAIQLVTCRFDFQVPVDLVEAPEHREYAVRALYRLLTTFEYDTLRALVERGSASASYRPRSARSRARTSSSTGGGA